MTTYIIESPPKMAARPDPAIYIPPPGLAYSRVQKLLAEFFGTFALVMFSAGAICADHFLRNTNETGLGLLGISLAYGLTYGAMIVAVGRVSGGHLNPAVTIGYWVTYRLVTIDTILYWAAQIGGLLTALRTRVAPS
jgi:aquaporin Z